MAGPRRLTALQERVLESAGSRMPAGPCVVALSGGADSAVCGWAALQMAPEARAVFVDHGLVSSRLMARAAADVASALDLPLHSVRVAVPPGPSPEAQSRRVRYQALESELGGEEFLLTGHTADDQAETVMLNVLRGTGLTGLAGIPARRGRICRPLLGVWRRETRELATVLGLPWRDDEANLDAHTPRNLLRVAVFPGFEQSFNPALREALVRLASHAASSEELLEERAARIPVIATSDEVRIPAPALATVPRPVAERAVRRALREARPPFAGPEREVTAVLEMASGGAARELSGGWEARREGPWLVLTPRADAPTPEPVGWALRGEVNFGSWRIEAWLEESPPSAYPLSDWTAVFDADLVPPKAEVRSARKEDVIAMTKGRKRVVRALAEAGVPVRQRGTWPVLTAGGEVLWVPGVRGAQPSWVTLHTRRYLWLRAEREER